MNSPVAFQRPPTLWFAVDALDVDALILSCETEPESGGQGIPTTTIVPVLDCLKFEWALIGSQSATLVTHTGADGAPVALLFADTAQETLTDDSIYRWAVGRSEGFQLRLTIRNPPGSLADDDEPLVVDFGIQISRGEWTGIAANRHPQYFVTIEVEYQEHEDDELEEVSNECKPVYGWGAIGTPDPDLTGGYLTSPTQLVYLASGSITLVHAFGFDPDYLRWRCADGGPWIETLITMPSFFEWNVSEGEILGPDAVSSIVVRHGDGEGEDFTATVTLKDNLFGKMDPDVVLDEVKDPSYPVDLRALNLDLDSYVDVLMNNDGIRDALTWVGSHTNSEHVGRFAALKCGLSDSFHHDLTVRSQESSVLSWQAEACGNVTEEIVPQSSSMHEVFVRYAAWPQRVDDTTSGFGLHFVTCRHPEIPFVYVDEPCRFFFEADTLEGHPGAPNETAFYHYWSVINSPNVFWDATEQDPNLPPTVYDPLFLGQYGYCSFLNNQWESHICEYSYGNRDQPHPVDEYGIGIMTFASITRHEALHAAHFASMWGYHSNRSNQFDPDGDWCRSSWEFMTPAPNDNSTTRYNSMDDTTYLDLWGYNPGPAGPLLDQEHWCMRRHVRFLEEARAYDWARKGMNWQDIE